VVAAAAGDREVIYVQTRMPDESGGGWRYDSPTLDLSITLPDTLPMDITDSSGDILLRGTHGAVDINDSSGDIIYNGVRAAVTIPEEKRR
jgi:hypothetical protein